MNISPFHPILDLEEEEIDEIDVLRLDSDFDTNEKSGCGEAETVSENTFDWIPFNSVLHDAPSVRESIRQRYTEVVLCVMCVLLL
jgi:hypothetical protein